MIALRRAHAGDASALQRLLAQVDGLHARLHPRFFAVGPRRAPALEHGAQDAAVFVAEEQRGTVGAAIVGAVLVRVYDTPADPLIVPQRRGYVEEIVVDQACRRQGVGRQLMEHAASWCRAQGARALLLTVWTGNAEAEAFYERIGYRVVNRVLGRELD